MDKETLSNYGWVVVVIVILAVLITLSTPFGSVIRNSITGSTNKLKDNAMNQMDNTLNSKDSTFIDQSDVDASNGSLIAIGKDNPLDVIATFSNSASKVTVTKNGVSSNGVMSDFLAGFLGIQETASGAVYISNSNGLADVNGDGMITQADASLLGQYLTGWSVTIDEDAANICVDGALDSKDSVALAYLLKRIQAVTSIEVKKGVTRIGDRAFAGFVNLKTVKIADTVTNIGADAFAGCTSLTSIVFEGDIPAGFVTPDGVTVKSRGSVIPFYTQENIDASSGALIAIGKNLLLDVVAERNSDGSQITINKNGYSTSGEMADFPAGLFGGHQSLGDVNSDGTINDDDGELLGQYLAAWAVTINEAQSDVVSDGTIDILDKMELASLVKKIEAVTQIAINPGVTSIGNRAFVGLVNVQTVRIADTVTHISASAFEECPSLTTIIFEADAAPVGFVAPAGVTIKYGG